MFGKRFRTAFPRIFIVLSIVSKFKVPVILQAVVFLHYLLKTGSVDKLLPTAYVIPCFFVTTSLFYGMIFNDMLEIAKDDPMAKLQTRDMDKRHKRWFYNAAAMEAYDLWFKKYKDREVRYLTSSRLCLYVVLSLQFIASFL